MKILVLVLAIFVATTNVAAKPGLVRAHRNTPEEEGCESLRMAGLALYEALMTLYPEEFQGMLGDAPVDLFNRDAVGDFLCTLAGVRSIADLALLLNMPERMVRQYYRAMIGQLHRSYVAGPGQNMFEENFKVWSISEDIVAFCLEVGFIERGDENSEELSSEQVQSYEEHSDEVGDNGQEQAVLEEGVDFLEALEFVEGMDEKHGADWENVLLGVLSRNAGLNLGDINLNATDLAAAIAFSSNVMEFATYTGIPYEFLMTASHVIRESQLPVEPGSDITNYDAYDKSMDVVFVAYHLGFFSLQ